MYSKKKDMPQIIGILTSLCLFQLRNNKLQTTELISINNHEALKG